MEPSSTGIRMKVPLPNIVLISAPATSKGQRCILLHILTVSLGVHSHPSWRKSALSHLGGFVWYISSRSGSPFVKIKTRKKQVFQIVSALTATMASLVTSMVWLRSEIRDLHLALGTWNLRRLLRLAPKFGRLFYIGALKTSTPLFSF